VAFTGRVLSGPILEFARAHVRHINSWIIAQYGMTRVEVENMMDKDWLSV
jgi:hypothetical protein